MEVYCEDRGLKDKVVEVRGRLPEFKVSLGSICAMGSTNVSVDKDTIEVWKQVGGILGRIFPILLNGERRVARYEKGRGLFIDEFGLKYKDMLINIFEEVLDDENPKVKSR